MRKFMYVFIAAVLCLGIGAAPASAAAKPKKYSSCTALKKVYPGGVAGLAKYKNKGGALLKKPTISFGIYKLNAGQDRDRDGIVCEVEKARKCAPYDPEWAEHLKIRVEYAYIAFQQVASNPVENLARREALNNYNSWSKKLSNYLYATCR